MRTGQHQTQERPLQEMTFTVSRLDDDQVQLGVAASGSLRVREHAVYRSVFALERALERVGLPSTLASRHGERVPLPVTLVQLSRLGFL